MVAAVQYRKRYKRGCVDAGRSVKAGGKELVGVVERTLN